MAKVIDILSGEQLDPQAIMPAGEVIVYADYGLDDNSKLPLPSLVFQQVIGQAVRNAGYAPVFLDDSGYDQAHQTVINGEAAGLVVVMPEDDPSEDLISGSVKTAYGSPSLVAIAASRGSKVAAFGTSTKAQETIQALEAHDAHLWPKDFREGVVGHQVLAWLDIAAPEQLPAS